MEPELPGIFFAHYFFFLLFIKLKQLFFRISETDNVDRVKRIWYLSPMRAAKVQASLHIRAVFLVTWLKLTKHS